MVTKAAMMRLIPYTLFYICCSVIGLMLIKTAGQSGPSFLGIKFNLRIILGLLIYLTGFCCYLFLIQNYKLSYIFPLVIGLNYVAVVLAAIFVLKESIGLYQWAGITAVFIGIVLMNLKPVGQ